MSGATLGVLMLDTRFPRIAGDIATADAASLTADHLAAAIVLECTNMPPYAAGVARATGLPVHDITTLLAARLRARAEPTEARR